MVSRKIPPSDESSSGTSKQAPEGTNYTVIATFVTTGVGVASVVVTAVTLPVQRAVLATCLIISALALMSLTLPTHWRALHRSVTIVLAMALAAAGISGSWPNKTTWPPPTTFPPTAPSPSEQSTTSTTPGGNGNNPPVSVTTGPGSIPDIASTLRTAFRGPGDGAITASVSTTIKYDGDSSLEIKFHKNADFYEAYFDLATLFPGFSTWNGRDFSCKARLGDLKNTDATWGGVLFKDHKDDNDYGPDIVFNHHAGEWIDLKATVGKQDDPNRWGGTAIYESNFVPHNLKGVVIFFAPSKEDYYTGKSVYLDRCTHT